MLLIALLGATPDTGLMAPDTVATGFNRPNCMAFKGDTLLIGQIDGSVMAFYEGKIWKLVDRLQPMVNGLLVVGDSLFISHRSRVSLWWNSKLEDLVVDLPSFGRNSNNGLALSPSGKIYLGQGNRDCGDTGSGLAGTLLCFNKDGSGLEVLFKGFQDPWALTYTGKTLWVSDPGCYPEDDPENTDRLWFWQGPDTGSVFLDPTSYPRGMCAKGDTLIVACYGDPFAPDQVVNSGILMVYRKKDKKARKTRYEVVKLPVAVKRPVDVEFGPDGKLWILERDSGSLLRVDFNRLIKGASGK